jgi:hypothetical protein
MSRSHVSKEVIHKNRKFWHNQSQKSRELPNAIRANGAYPG